MTLTVHERRVKWALFAEGWKRCGRCGEVQMIEAFSKNRSREDGYSAT